MKLACRRDAALPTRETFSPAASNQPPCVIARRVAEDAPGVLIREWLRGDHARPVGLDARRDGRWLVPAQAEHGREHHLAAVLEAGLANCEGAGLGIEAADHVIGRSQASTLTMTSRISPPWAPAFAHAAPPSVPGCWFRIRARQGQPP